MDPWRPTLQVTRDYQRALERATGRPVRREVLQRFEEAHLHILRGSGIEPGMDEASIRAKTRAHHDARGKA